MSPKDEVVVRVPVLKIGQPTENGRIYSEEVVRGEVERLQDRVEKRMFFTTQTRNTPVTLADISGVVTEMHIDGDDLIAQIEIIPTVPRGRFAQQLIQSGNVQYAPYGTGVVGEDGVVSDWTMEGVSISPKYHPTKPWEI